MAAREPALTVRGEVPWVVLVVGVSWGADAREWLSDRWSIGEKPIGGRPANVMPHGASPVTVPCVGGFLV